MSGDCERVRAAQRHVEEGGCAQRFAWRPSSIRARRKLRRLRTIWRRRRATETGDGVFSSAPPTSGLLLVLLLATVPRLAATGNSWSACVSEQRAARATIVTAFETTVSRRVQSSGSSVFRSHSLGAARRSAHHRRDGCQPNAKQRILHRGLPRRLDTVVARTERAHGLNSVCPRSFHSFNIAEHVGRAWLEA